MFNIFKDTRIIHEINQVGRKMTSFFKNNKPKNNKESKVEYLESVFSEKDMIKDRLVEEETESSLIDFMESMGNVAMKNPLKAISSVSSGLLASICCPEETARVVLTYVGFMYSKNFVNLLLEEYYPGRRKGEKAFFEKPFSSTACFAYMLYKEPRVSMNKALALRESVVSNTKSLVRGTINQSVTTSIKFVKAMFFMKEKENRELFFGCYQSVFGLMREVIVIGFISSPVNTLGDFFPEIQRRAMIKMPMKEVELIRLKSQPLIKGGAKVLAKKSARAVEVARPAIKWGGGLMAVYAYLGLPISWGLKLGMLYGAFKDSELFRDVKKLIVENALPEGFKKIIKSIHCGIFAGILLSVVLFINYLLQTTVYGGLIAILLLIALIGCVIGWFVKVEVISV